jgi:sugar (pentulose or hexulose) kinase
VNRGVFASLEEAVAACATPTERVDPDARRSAEYDRLFQAYLQALQALRPTFADLDAI